MHGIRLQASRPLGLRKVNKAHGCHVRDTVRAPNGDTVYAKPIASALMCPDKGLATRYAKPIACNQSPKPGHGRQQTSPKKDMSPPP